MLLETSVETICKFCGVLCQTSKHHVVPRAKGGKETVPTCQTCESFIHKTWSHNQLRDVYNTVESILATLEFQKFLKWRRKQDTTAVFRTQANKFREKGRYR